jgi:WD40 repeat protein
MSDTDDLGKTRLSVKAGEATTAGRVALPEQAQGRYTVPEGVVDPELARGGMGRILTLHDTHLQREVAVKELLTEHTAANSSTGPLLENLFVREARVLARLEHPGVVPVYELGRRADGAPYYAMRRIRGRTLAAALDDCTSFEERLSLLPHYVDVVQTVAYAHSRGVVHRDLKPENVMVDRFGQTQVIDWGLAVVGDEPPEGGVMAGTPSYMAPEVAKGAFVDARSDVWALGIMLFELLTGRLPWTKSEASAVLDEVRTAPLPDVKALEPATPPALLAVLQRALQRDPAARFQDAGAMAEALEAAQRARAPKPVGWWLLAGGLGALALVLGVVAWGARSRAEDTARDARLAVDDARRDALGSKARAALAALRARDTFTADRLAAEAKLDPLARGVGLLAKERGVPERRWTAKAPAGCSAVAVAGRTSACATLNGVLLFGPEGQQEGELATGPRGWQHGLVALSRTIVATAGDDKVVRLFDVPSRKEAQAFAALDAPVLALASEKDALVAGLANGDVVRLGPKDAKQVVGHHPRPVNVVTATPGTVASASEGTLRLDGPSPAELDRHVGAATFVTATQLAIGVERSVVLLEEGNVKWVATGHRDEVTALVFVPEEDGPGRLVSGSADGTVRWWYPDGTLEGLLEGFAPGVQALSATADGTLLVATRDRRLEAWTLPKRPFLPAVEGLTSAWAWWPGQGLAFGTREGKLHRIDQGKPVMRDLEARHTGVVRAIAPNLAPAHPDAVRFVSGGDDGRVLLQRWNGEVETLDSLPGARVLAVAVSPEGHRAAWAADDGTRVLWSLEFGKEIHRERDTLVRALAFSPDSRTLAVGREDKHVALLDVESGKEKERLGPLDGAATALAWSSKGAFLVTGGGDGRLTTWDVAAKRALKALTQPQGRITSIAMRSDDSAFIAGSEDGSAWLYERESGALLAQVPTDAGDVLLVAFTDDGVLTVGADRVVHLLKP